MKAIDLQTIIKPVFWASHLTKDKLYHVYLGNAVHKEFKNLKDAKKFLADTNRFLNFKLQETNSILVEVYGHYRRNWFYFSARKRAMDYKDMKKEIICEQAFKDIERSFNLMIERSHLNNWNHLIFSHFDKICNNFYQVIEVLKVINKSKSNAVDLHQLEMLYQRTCIVQDSIAKYGTVEFERFDKVVQEQHKISRLRIA